MYRMNYGIVQNAVELGQNKHVTSQLHFVFSNFGGEMV